MGVGGWVCRRVAGTQLPWHATGKQRARDGCESGRTVVIDADGSYVHSKASGVRAGIKKRDGVRAFDVQMEKAIAGRKRAGGPS